MNAALLFVHVLACLVAVKFLSVDGQDSPACCTNCCDDLCPAPDPFNVSLAEFQEDQPLYVVFYPNVAVVAGVDSSCYTFFPTPDGNYLMNVVRKYSSGLTIRESYVIGEQAPGDFTAGSPSCNQEIVIFDYVETSPDCEVYLAYFCFSGDCSLAQGNPIPVQGFSSNNQAIDEECLAEIVDRIERAGIPSQEYIIVPMEMPAECVTEIPCTIE